MTDRAGDARDLPLAMLALAGRTLAERQLDLVLALGCERIVCLSQGIDKGMIALQHRAEAAGAKFNLIAGPRPLAGLVSAADELVVVSEGLLPVVSEARRALESGAGVLALPVEPGIAAGFERIDLNHAWAGVLMMPGRLVERLSQLPPDCDAVSALLRIALQGRVPYRILPETLLAERRWALIRNDAQLSELEPVWLRRHMAPPILMAPGRGLARLVMHRAGAPLLAKGWKPAFMSGAGVLLGGLGAVAASFGHGAVGIIACGLGWFSLEMATALGAIVRAGADDETVNDKSGTLAGIIIDILLIWVLAMTLSGIWYERIFAPIVLIAVARLSGRLITLKTAELVQDRAVLAIVLAIAAAAGALLPVTQFVALGILILLLSLSRGNPQLTQA